MCLTQSVSAAAKLWRLTEECRAEHVCNQQKFRTVKWRSACLYEGRQDGGVGSKTLQKLQKLRIISRPIARGSAASLSPFQTRWPECMMEARLETTGSFLRHPITCASLKCYLIAGRWTDVRSNDYSSHRRPILNRGGLEYRTAGCVAHGFGSRQTDSQHLLQMCETRLTVITSCDSVALASTLISASHVVARDMVSSKMMTAWVEAFYGTLPHRPLSDA